MNRTGRNTTSTCNMRDNWTKYNSSERIFSMLVDPAATWRGLVSRSLLLERADVHDRDTVAVAVLEPGEAGATLIEGRHAGVVARVDGQAPGLQGIGLGRAAVV